MIELQREYRVCSAACPRDEVINFQPPKHVLLDTETIPTALSCLSTETRTYGLRDVSVTHADKGFRNPRRTAS